MELKRSIKSIFHAIKILFSFLDFLIKILRAKHKNILKYEKQHEGRMAVIATGPSLKKEISYIQDQKYMESTDFLMLNFSAFDPLFFELKPKHYCLADPMYFKSSWRDKEVFRFFEIIDTKVDWNMTIYVPADSRNNFISFSKISNKYISVLGINTKEFNGFESFRHYFYRKGVASPPPQTVTNMAVFIGIQRGYRDIDLFGVDHTFLSSLKINEKNQLCQIYYHSYDKETPEYKVIYRTDNNEVWRCGDYIIACGKMFVSHDLLADYAKKVGCHIVNHTKCSMIDSYERFSG